MDLRVVLHAADEGPVRLSAVHLGAGAAVYGERRDADILQPEGDLLDVLRLLVPSQPGLDRYGGLHGADDLPRHLDHQRHVAHHARTGAASGDLLHRAAEVDVDDVGPGRFGHAGRLDHRFDQMAVDLNAHGAFRVVDFEFLERLGGIADEPVRGDELRVDHVGAETFAHVAERGVRNVLHGGEQQGLFSEVYVGDFHASSGSCGRWVTSILSIRAPSMSTISNEKPHHSSFSPVAGICPSRSRIRPLTVL